MTDAETPAWPFLPRRGRPPMGIARAEGAWLYTEDGRRILDAAGGAIVANIGHGRREVAEAAARAMERVSYVVPPFVTEERTRLAERLRDRWLPPGVTRFFPTSGGSESVDAAIRLARQHHVSAGRAGRWKVIGRDLSYHGATIATLGLGGNTKRRQAFAPLVPELPKAPACYCLRCPLEKTYPDCRVACADALEDVIRAEGPETVAAFILEPIGGSTGGVLDPPDDYLARIAEICRRYEVLLIADEVMCGFGRTGKRFAVEHFGVTPDILVGGKGLAGGYAPIGGVFATDAVIEPLVERGDDLMFFTFGGHPTSCAVADCVLDILEREALVERAAAVGEQLRKRLATLEQHPHVAEVRGRGLLLGIELVRDRSTLEPFAPEDRLTQRVVGAGLRHGVFLYPGGTDPARDAIVLGPPFIIGDEEVEMIASVLETAIDEGVARVEQSGGAS